MRHKELHVFEESNHLFWGLIILVATAVGTYLLAGSFVTMDWYPFNVRQLLALGLYAISFTGIIKLSEPLYHFILYFRDSDLMIDIKKGDLKTDTLRIPVDNLQQLKFTPHTSRDADEALFDFSTSYHLLYQKKGDETFYKLLGDQSASITLKVDDIADIMRFISDKNPDIHIPNEQAAYFNL
ncbi:hypothetical protein [Fodinibius sp. Rm-B-1B1-1]|uniref:hypothetical protein n=1 Tax=Fodinibius alkaliphilus TaxID=3140241 RepID=UPI00315B1CAD